MPRLSAPIDIPCRRETSSRQSVEAAKVLHGPIPGHTSRRAALPRDHLSWLVATFLFASCLSFAGTLFAQDGGGDPCEGCEDGGGGGGSCNSPSITSQPTNQTVCEGHSVSFSVSATGDAPLSYQWINYRGYLSDGGSISGSTSPTLMLSGLSPDDSGSSFEVRVANTCGGLVSSQATLTVNWSPFTASISGPDEVSAQSTNTYGAPSGSGLSYGWSISGEAVIVGATNGQSVSVAANMGDVFTLTLNMSNGDCSPTAGKTVSIFGPALIITQPVSQVVCPGGTATFSVAATGSSLTYQWRKDGVSLINGGNISGATSTTLTITNVSSSGSICHSVSSSNGSGTSFGTVIAGQTYTYQASGCAIRGGGNNVDPDGNQYSDFSCSVFVQKQPAWSGCICPSLTAFSLVGEVGGACIQLGKSGTFVAPATGTLLLYMNDDYFYNNTSSWDVCVTQSYDGAYDVVVTSGDDSLISAPATLTAATPTATVSGSATICSSQSTVIQATLTGTPPWYLKWSDGVTQNNVSTSPATRTVSPPTNFTYTVTGFSDAQCTGSSMSSAVVAIVSSGGSTAKPTFNPEGGAYLRSLSVTVSCATAWATIHYTTNGLMPTLDDPVVASGQAVSLSQLTLLRARAFTNALCASDIKSGLYQIGPQIVGAGTNGIGSSFLLCTNGTVWAWGADNTGQLGDGRQLGDGTYGTDIIVVLPEALSTISNVWAIAAAPHRTVACDTNGVVWEWGVRLDEDFPGDFTTNPAVPMYVSGGTNAASVASSVWHSLVLCTDATIKVWGDNQEGDLGWDTNGDPIYEDWPWKQMATLTTVPNVTAVAANGEQYSKYSLALCTNGTVWAWG